MLIYSFILSKGLRPLPPAPYCCSWLVGACLLDLLCFAYRFLGCMGSQFAYIGDLLMSFSMPLGSILDALGWPWVPGACILRPWSHLDHSLEAFDAFWGYLGWPGDPIYAIWHCRLGRSAYLLGSRLPGWEAWGPRSIQSLR